MEWLAVNTNLYETSIAFPASETPYSYYKPFRCWLFSADKNNAVCSISREIKYITQIVHTASSWGKQSFCCQPPKEMCHYINPSVNGSIEYNNIATKKQIGTAFGTINRFEYIVINIPAHSKGWIRLKPKRGCYKFLERVWARTASELEYCNCSLRKTDILKLSR